MKSRVFAALLFTFAAIQSVAVAAAPMKALIVDGQNNHGAWPKTTFMMKKYLEETGLFEVSIARTKYTWNGGNLLKQFPLEGVETTATPRAQHDPDFSPDSTNAFLNNLSPLLCHHCDSMVAGPFDSGSVAA